MISDRPIFITDANNAKLLTPDPEMIKLLNKIIDLNGLVITMICSPVMYQVNVKED
jgi:hypothetical protein